MLVLDSGGLSRLSARTKTAAALIRALSDMDLWPPVVPTVVLVESLRGDPKRDANTHRFLKMCIVDTVVSERVARRAAELRRKARAGSAVDALIVAVAEPGGTVLTGDAADIEALAAHADNVAVELI
jgi:predicted nucleic acid-binding protein